MSENATVLTTETLWYLGPEATLVLTAVVLYLRGVFRRWEDQPIAAGKSLSQDTLSLQIALVGVVLAGWALVRIGLPQESVGPVILDPLGLYIRWLSLAAIGLLVLLASTDASRTNRPEYLGTVLLAGAGVMAVAAADNLVLLFVALELVSIPTYIVLCLGRRDADGYEASAKYFFLSLAASAMTLYGISFLYGASGSLELTAIRQNLVGKLSVSEGYFSDFTQLGVIFLLAGLGFKITAAPFHFYAPDVYQGTSYPNAALLSAAPKIAGFTALVRILIESLWPWEQHGFGWRVVLALAILTMTVGNTAALWQTHLRRLLAYSSVGQAGYILAALAVALGAETAESRSDGLAAVLLYLAVYAAATIGAFSVFEGIRRSGRPVETMEDLAGLSRHRPWSAAWLAIFMFSLAGVPPLAGFWGKWAVVLGAIQSSLSPRTGTQQSLWFMILAAAVMLNAAAAAAYYLRVVAAAYFRPPAQTHTAAGPAGPWIAAVLCGLLCVGIGLMPWPLWNTAASAVEPLAQPGQPLIFWDSSDGNPELGVQTIPAVSLLSPEDAADSSLVHFVFFAPERD